MNRLTAINRVLLTVILLGSWTVTTSHCPLAAATTAIVTAQTPSLGQTPGVVVRYASRQPRTGTPGSAEHVLTSRPTENTEAYQLYLKGRYFWNRRTPENIVKALNSFQQAIDKDP